MSCSPPNRLPPGVAPVVLHRRGGSARAEPSRAAELLQRGYTRRTTATEPRLSEIVAEYRRIGFEVEVIDHEPDPQQCNVCFDDSGAGQRDVYVRSPASAPPRDALA